MNEEKAVEEQSKPLVLEKLAADHADALLGQDEVRGTAVVIVRPERAYAVLEYLKTDTELAYTYLVDVTAVDNSQMESELMQFDYATIHGCLSALFLSRAVSPSSQSSCA